jgi:hypothetical protein
MKIDEFDLMVVSPVDKDELVAEISKEGYELASVYIEGGKPVISIGPNRMDEYGVWTIDYCTFKQIIKAVDDFLISIGYSFETEIGEERN